MTAPVVTPMSPGEKPTEPGWYVVTDGSERFVVEVEESRGNLFASRTGSDDCVGVKADWLVFIARIYPERIEAGTDE